MFAANRVVIVPAGIGLRGPLRTSAGRITHALCYGQAATLEPTGLVLLRPGSHLTVADLFRSWGQPLSAVRLGPFRADPGHRVEVFMNGRRWYGPPGDVPLSRHSEIVPTPSRPEPSVGMLGPVMLVPGPRGVVFRRLAPLALMPAAAFAVHQLRYWLAFHGVGGYGW